MSDNPFDIFGTLPDSVTSDSRRSIIANTLPGLLNEDYSITQAFNIYKSNGLGIRYSDFRQIWRDVTGEMADASRIRFVRGDAMPSDAILRIADRPIAGNYRFVGQFSGVDNDTGERTVFTASFDFDDKDTIDGMLEQMFEYLSNSDSFGKYNVEEGSIIRGYISQ